ncbi:MAG: HNH endonuclease [Ilumatobacteraceae bacterium]
MEQHLGRKLDPREHVHHENRDRSDNRLENLRVIGIADHAREHHAGRDPSRWDLVECAECGTEFERRRLELQAHPDAYCNRACYVRSRRKGKQRACAHCGATFSTIGRPNAKFCGRECYHASRRA